MSKIVLITGASHTDSIGYTAARQLALQYGFTILLGSRSSPISPSVQNAVKQLESEGAKNGVHAVQIDVTSDESIKAAAKDVEEKFGRLDVLVNNAGIAFSKARANIQDAWPKLPHPSLQHTRQDFQELFEVNVYGTAQAVNVFAPLLAKSPSPRIVNVTSELGSLTRSAGLGKALLVGYASSKAAVNMITVQYSKELPSLNPKFKINAGCPGYVKTSFNNYNGVRTPDEGAAVITYLATIPDDGPNGGAFSDHPPESQKNGDFQPMAW